MTQGLVCSQGFVLCLSPLMQSEIPMGVSHHIKIRHCNSFGGHCIARVELTHGTALLVREGWTEVVQELAAVGLVPPGPEREEANDPLSPATRFLRHLEEDLVPWHFDYTVDSDRDYLHPHSPL